MPTNERLFNQYSSLNQAILVERIKGAEVGKKSTPSLI